MCMRCQQNPTITQTLPKSINSQLCNHTCLVKTPIKQISNLSHRQMLTIQNHSLYQQNHTLTPQSKLFVSLYLSSTTHHQLTPQKPCCRKAEPHDSQPCFYLFLVPTSSPSLSKLWLADTQTARPNSLCETFVSGAQSGTTSFTNRLVREMHV